MSFYKRCREYFTTPKLFVMSNVENKELSSEEYIKKWFKEPYKSQLLKNTKKRELEEPYSHIGGLFVWSQSPEGDDYWSQIHRDIDQGKTDKYIYSPTQSVKGFLNSLNDPYRIQALSYTKHVHDKLVSSLVEAIDQVDWALSKEGTAYWSEIYRDISHNILLEKYIKEEYLFYKTNKII